jgi:hypothetical protein
MTHRPETRRYASAAPSQREGRSRLFEWQPLIRRTVEWRRQTGAHLSVDSAFVTISGLNEPVIIYRTDGISAIARRH